MVFCQKASSNHYFNLNYLGRYIKKPPIADSRLKHYDANNVIISYLDHKTDQHLQISFSLFDFITRLVQHIPDTNFRMIRYYGILANRVRSKLLPIFYLFLGQKRLDQTSRFSYASLLISNFNIDPMKCPKCKKPMLLAFVSYKSFNIHSLLNNHHNLAVNAFC